MKSYGKNKLNMQKKLFTKSLQVLGPVRFFLNLSAKLITLFNFKFLLAVTKESVIQDTSVFINIMFCTFLFFSLIKHSINKPRRKTRPVYCGLFLSSLMISTACSLIILIEVIPRGNQYSDHTLDFNLQWEASAESKD